MTKSHSDIIYEGEVIDVPGIGRRPRVTTVLDQMSKPALIQWAANMASEHAQDVILAIKNGKLNADEVLALDIKEFVRDAKTAHTKKLEEAGDIGTRIHKIAENIFRNMMDAKKEGTSGDIEINIEIDEDIKNPVNALLAWIEQHRIDPMVVEEIVISESFGGYIGRPDSISFVDDKLFLIDVKTSKAVYDGFPQQVAAYDHAAAETLKGLSTDGTAILRLDKETGYPFFHPFTKEQTEDYLQEFGLWCLIWHTKDKRRERENEAWEREKDRIRELKKTLPKILRKLPEGEDPF